MGPYKQDYEVVQLKLNCVESKNSTVALVGVFYIRSATDQPPVQIPNEKTLIESSVILESIFSDCVAFTPTSEALEIFTEEHTNSINEFLRDIEQDAIVIYGGSDERYIYTLMRLMVDIANEMGKKIVCFASNPAHYMGRAKYFETPWEHIESNVYKAILFDFSHEFREFMKTEEHFTFQGQRDFMDQILSKNLNFIAGFLEFIDINTLYKLEAVVGEKASLITYEDSIARRLEVSANKPTY